MDIAIRTEAPGDLAGIDSMVIRAYKSIPYSDHTEQVMIRRLRESPAYIPQLALIAEAGTEIVGHVMLTRVSIRNQERVVPSLALTPLSVAPAYQRQRVGNGLVIAAHERARAVGFHSIVLLGIPGYFSRFGYEPLHRYDISVPFDIRDENCMILPLKPDALAGVRGVVEYPQEWTER